jgi:outer membrane cobalamin receptor
LPACRAISPTSKAGSICRKGEGQRGRALCRRTFDRAGSRATLPDYWLVDLRVQWRVAGGLTVHGRIENLADRHYETASGYGSLGRTVYIGLRSRF